RMRSNKSLRAPLGALLSNTSASEAQNTFGRPPLAVLAHCSGLRQMAGEGHPPPLWTPFDAMKSVVHHFLPLAIIPSLRPLLASKPGLNVWLVHSILLFSAIGSFLNLLCGLTRTRCCGIVQSLRQGHAALRCVLSLAEEHFPDGLATADLVRRHDDQLGAAESADQISPTVAVDPLEYLRECDVRHVGIDQVGPVAIGAVGLVGASAIALAIHGHSLAQKTCALLKGPTWWFRCFGWFLSCQRVGDGKMYVHVHAIWLPSPGNRGGTNHRNLANQHITPSPRTSGLLYSWSTYQRIALFLVGEKLASL